MKLIICVVLICALHKGLLAQTQAKLSNTIKKDREDYNESIDDSILLCNTNEFDDQTHTTEIPYDRIDEDDEIDYEKVQKSIEIMSKMNASDYDVDIMKKTLPGYGRTWMFFPDGEGIPRPVSLREGAQGRSTYIMETDVTFHLYTRNNVNDSQIVKPYKISDIISTNFDADKKLIVITHGWKSSYTAGICQKIKNAYLKTDDVNVICVDWSPISQSMWYMTPVHETRNVGNYLAQLLDALVGIGLSVNNIHVMGHSLGAHVCGYAGKFFKNGKLPRITGFDPALPGFEYIGGVDNRLDAGDADFVDIIHTCVGSLGFYDPLGHVDFYPNDGSAPQPGCGGLPHLLESCSHSRSYEYYAESVENRKGFLGELCGSYVRFKTGSCKSGVLIAMGPNTPSSARGIYYLQTRQVSPFAMGNPANFQKKDGGYWWFGK